MGKKGKMQQVNIAKVKTVNMKIIKNEAYFPFIYSKTIYWAISGRRYCKLSGYSCEHDNLFKEHQNSTQNIQWEKD